MPRLLPNLQYAAIAATAFFLAACGSAPPKPAAKPPTGSASAPPTSSKYYKDDGPGANPPDNLDQIPDAVPRVETLHRFANRPYTVLGKDYVPATALRPYRERGIASWYGRKFHGQKTSNGETYDMYAMTAAHPTLPLPSYVRVTNVASGRSVVVRVNDRGPFLHGRIIDLSFAAAHKLNIAGKGSGEVEVEAIIPGEATMIARAPLPAVAPPPAVAAVPASSDATVATATAPAGLAQQAPAAISPEAGGFAVQLGAFTNFGNAQNFLARVQGELATAQVQPKVREAGGLYRVYVGPYPNRDEARQVADRISGAFGFDATVAPH